MLGAFGARAERLAAAASARPAQGLEGNALLLLTAAEDVLLGGQCYRSTVHTAADGSCECGLETRVKMHIHGVVGRHTVLLFPPKCIFLSEMHVVSVTVLAPLLFVFQSKEIGLQMHEELLKVTNELYTVSNELTLRMPSLCSEGNAGNVIC